MRQFILIFTIIVGAQALEAAPGLWSLGRLLPEACSGALRASRPLVARKVATCAANSAGYCGGACYGGACGGETCYDKEKDPLSTSVLPVDSGYNFLLIAALRKMMGKQIPADEIVQHHAYRQAGDLQEKYTQILTQPAGDLYQ